MPSGRVHDRITGTLSPLAAVGVGLWGQRWELATLAALGVLVSGFFLSPDLDVRSRPYRRWGWLAGVWWPYQKLIPHRSWLSHGPLIGTALRLGYLAAWVGLLGWGLDWVGQKMGWWQWPWQQGLAWLQYSWQEDPQAWIVGLISLEVGAMGHYLSDFGDSWIKQSRRRKPSET